MNVQTFPSVMADLPVNLDHPNRTLISGLFRESAPVNGTKREFFTYIPKDLDYDSQCLVVDPLAQLRRPILKRWA